MNFFKDLLTKVFGNKLSTSDKFQFNTTDLKKSLRHASFAALAAGLAIVVNDVKLLNLGEYTAVAVPVISLAIDAVYRWARKNAEAPV